MISTQEANNIIQQLEHQAFLYNQQVSESVYSDNEKMFLESMRDLYLMLSKKLKEKNK